MSERSIRRERAKWAVREDRRALRAKIAGTSVALAAVAVPAVARADDTITVTSNANSGAGTLRAALASANSSPDRDTINFAPNVRGEINTSNVLTVTYPTAIDGPGSSNLLLFASDTGALLFTPAQPGTLSVEGLSMYGGPYGYLPESSTLTGLCTTADASIELRDVQIADSYTHEAGGAIFTDGCDLSLEQSKLTGNTALLADNPSAALDGGAIAVADSAGGGVANTLTIDGSVLRGNKAAAEGGAISVRGNAQPEVTIRNSTISDNASGNGGGALNLLGVGNVTLERSTISGNRTVGAGGGMHLVYGGSLTIDSSTISGNIASGRGGGIFAYAHRGPFLVKASTISGNSGGRGGGIYSFNYYDAPAKVSNSTIVGNAGGGIGVDGTNETNPSAAGLDEMSISSSIVANSVAGNDISNETPAAGGSFRIDHSLIGVTAAGNPAIVESVPGSNFLNTGGLAIQPLVDNGGPTKTMLPVIGTPVIDSGIANGLTVDQRGSPRAVDAPVANGAGDGTDMGAAEQTDVAVQGVAVGAKSVQKQRGKKVAVVVDVTAGEPSDASASGVVRVGGKELALADARARLDAGQSIELKLAPAGRRSTKKVAKALAKGKKVTASVDVTLADDIGNTETDSETIRLKGRHKHKR